MKSCTACGSYAINHKSHGRDGSEPELCDVCFWRKRAEAAYNLEWTMRRFTVKTVHGRHLVVGGILPAHLVKAGQTWAPADGANHEVEITKIEDGWVTYRWNSGAHEKDMFAFQCRYCLTLPTAELPEELKRAF
mgnify:CR=1 FL=1